VAFHPEDRVVASCSEDKSIKLWNLDDGGLISTMTGHTDRVTGVCFDPTGKTIVSCSMDKTIRFWDSATGAAIGSPVSGPRYVQFTIFFSIFDPV
jgi:WD40 repeat protein